jgi:uncharacterized membrane protein
LNSIASITDFIGRFHPVLVHLPIGILLMAVVFHLLSYKKKFEVLQPALKISLLLGALGAIVSCISGFLLSQSGEYDEALVSTHQWFGIGLSVIGLLAYYFAVKNIQYNKWLMPLMGLLIIITGHLGGSLTHGEDFLTKSFSLKEGGGAVTNKLIPNVQQVVAYNDIVKPILEAKCYTCHGTAKQKGKLRLDETAFIDKGGEEGKVIIAGSAGESELIKRMLLPLDNEDHMPPKEKPQPTKAQIELLNWWINSGADYHKKVAELNQPEKVKPYLTALQNSGKKKVVAAPADIPENAVDKAPAAVMQKLKALDVAVSPVSQSSNYLQVNFVAVDSVTTQQLQLLKVLSKQIIWLKMGAVTISDSVLATIGSLSNLTRLFLDRTNITDKNIGYLKNLSQLQYLNLSGTAVTVDGLNTLKGLTSLKNLFLYKTNISAEGLGTLQKTFSKAVIDTGGYRLPFLATDTMEVKEKTVKK